MKIEEMSIGELVHRYRIVRYDDKVRFFPTSGENPYKVAEVIGKRKPEIMEFLIKREQEQAAEQAECNRRYEERQRKMNAVPGLAEMKKYREDLLNYREEFNRCMEDESCVRYPAEPKKPDFSQYKLAAAVIKAENYSLAANDRKATAGKKALDKLLDGEDIDATLEEMENWLPESAIWD